MGRQSRRLTPEQRALMAANLNLVYKLAHRYKRARVLTFHELVSEGCIVMARYIIPRWSADLGAFSTYAIPSLARYMKGAIRKAEKRRATQEPPADVRSRRPPDLSQIPEREEALRAREPLFALEDYLEELDDFQCTVIIQHYGLMGAVPQTLARIAFNERRTIDEVSEAHRKALYLMRLAAGEDWREAA